MITRNKINEMSGGGGAGAGGVGSVEGAPRGAFDGDTGEEPLDDVEEVNNESELLEKFVRLKIKQYLKELDFLSFLNESTPISNDPNSNSTGLNELDTLLQNILPVLEDAFKNLTTSNEQREQFRAYVINGASNLIKNAMADRIDSGVVEQEVPEELMEEVDKTRYKNLDVKSGEAAPSEEDQEIDVMERGLDVQDGDKTGRNVALKVFKNVSTQIVDSFSVLDNKDDQYIFFKYLLLNLKKWFDTWEDELNIDLTN